MERIVLMVSDVNTCIVSPENGCWIIIGVWSLFALNRHVETEVGSEKGFGIVFSIVFCIIGLYPLVDGKEVRVWSVSIAILLLFISFSKPKVLSVPNRLWFKFGVMLGAIVSPVVMAFVYFLTVVPTGILMRLFGKDLLRKKLDKTTKSYWAERNQNIGSMKDQF